MEHIFIDFLESREEKRVKRSDSPVSFTGRRGAIFMIVIAVLYFILLGVLYDPSLWNEKDVVFMNIFFILWACFGLAILRYGYRNLNAEVILTNESITITGVIKDSEKRVVRESVEIKWSELVKIGRPGAGKMHLYFYTKSGRGYYMNIGCFDTKLVPTLSKYKKIEYVYKLKPFSE